MDDPVSDILEMFIKYTKIGWLLLIALDKVENEKDELRDLDSQLKHHINDLKIVVHPERKL